MRKEEELLRRFPDLTDMSANLQLGSAAAASTAVLGSTHANATAVAAAAAAMGSALRASSAADASLPAAGSSHADPTVPGALPQLASGDANAGGQREQPGESWSTGVLASQLHVLQQGLSGQQGVAGLLAGYQAWLEDVKSRLLEQHEATQVITTHA